MAICQPNLDGADALFKKKQYNKAEQYIKGYLQSYPKDLEGIELLGHAYFHQEKWDEAINTYESLIEVQPKNANYQFKYGGVLALKAKSISKLRALGLIGDAKDALIKSANLDPNHIEVRWALVELYMQLPGIVGGSKTKSLKYANELQNISKVDGYLAKGYIYEYDDKLELAEKYYKMAIKEGGSLTCFQKLTDLYENEDAPEKAIANIEAAQKRHERNALHYQIGKISAEYNIQLQKGERCLKTYLKNYSLKDGVPMAWAHYRLAQIHMHQNNKLEALKYIDLALAELPEIKPFKEQKELILSL
ncbi:tetratricopeptide repeat protein [Hyunsoonleella aestuarii]|uniref:Tetratricopeptide repeat protein n=1 Tax=Hyunsoonleella aestuarii TaxID=912802 RepID=A0ABP8E7S6_9FLAO|nr:tetratricopeptide repeat protein [Hyunsoonleella aestuarii]